MHNMLINPYYRPIIIAFLINPVYLSLLVNKHRHSDNHSYGTNYASFLQSNNYTFLHFKNVKVELFGLIFTELFQLKIEELFRDTLYILGLHFINKSY